MKVHNIRQNIPNSEIMNSIEYCINRQKNVDAGEIVSELRNLDSSLEEFATVFNSNGLTHDIVLIYSIQTKVKTEFGKIAKMSLNDNIKAWKG